MGTASTVSLSVIYFQLEQCRTVTVMSESAVEAALNACEAALPTTNIKSVNQ